MSASFTEKGMFWYGDILPWMTGARATAPIEDPGRRPQSRSLHGAASP
jgi:hypothetical protein